MSVGTVSDLVVTSGVQRTTGSEAGLPPTACLMHFPLKSFWKLVQIKPHQTTADSCGLWSFSSVLPGRVRSNHTKLQCRGVLTQVMCFFSHRESLYNLLSALYALLLIVIGAVLPTAEVFSTSVARDGFEVRSPTFLAFHFQ